MSQLKHSKLRYYGSVVTMTFKLMNPKSVGVFLYRSNRLRYATMKVMTDGQT